MKSPCVSDWVIWVAMECSRQDLSIFLRTSTTWSGFCGPQMIRLWRFTFPDKWKVASSLKTILSKNKFYSLRQFSISVQKFLRCGLNSWSSWNLYGRKDNLIRSSLHTVMWEISPSSLLDRRTWTKHSYTSYRYYSSFGHNKFWELYTLFCYILYFKGPVFNTAARKFLRPIVNHELFTGKKH
jgi:hypothetical protein